MAQSREEVVETMKDVLASELGVEADKVTADARFKEDLDADSLDLVEVVLALEEKFGIEISDDQIAGVKTVGEAADLVISKQSASGSRTTGTPSAPASPGSARSPWSTRSRCRPRWRPSAWSSTRRPASGPRRPGAWTARPSSP